jgi:hypothetical protein
MKDRDSNRHYSASDPKLFVDNDKIYVYWTVVDHVPGEGFIDLTARGTELELQSGVLRPKGEKEQTIYSIDPRGTTEVLELHLNDPTANAVADIYDVRKINGDIIATVAIGGGGSDGKEERCVDQASHNKGCYHLVLLSASAPLGKDVFNRRISGDHSLPYNPVGYAHFIRGPDGKSAIMGTFLPPVAHDPNYNYAPAGLAILNLAGF